jgi:hypothetical protein
VALVVGAVEAAEVMKIIVGTEAPVGNRLLVCDLWDNLWRTVDLSPLAAAGCPTCRGNDFPWLEGRSGTQATVLCGRDAVQVAPGPGLAEIDLAAFAERMAAVGRVVANRWIVRVTVEEGIELIPPAHQGLVGPRWVDQQGQGRQIGLQLAVQAELLGLGQGPRITLGPLKSLPPVAQPLHALLALAAGPQLLQGLPIEHGRQPRQGQGPRRFLRAETPAGGSCQVEVGKGRADSRAAVHQFAPGGGSTPALQQAARHG